MTFKIEESVKNQSIESLERDEKIMQFLRDMGCKTIRDVIDRQDEIPEDYMTKIKTKLIFNI